MVHENLSVSLFACYFLRQPYFWGQKHPPKHTDQSPASLLWVFSGLFALMAQGSRQLGFITWKMKLLTMWTEVSLQPYDLLFLLKCIYFVITAENTSVFRASEYLCVAIFSFSDITRKLLFVSCKTYTYICIKISFVCNHTSLAKAWDIIVTKS